MNHARLFNPIFSTTLAIDGCRIYISIADDNGEQTLNVACQIPPDENYEEISSFFRKNNAETQELYSEEMNMTFKVPLMNTLFSLWLEDPISD